MRLYLGRELRVNMDNYEHATVSAGVTVDHTDLGLSDDDVRRMTPGERDDLRERIRATALDWLAVNLSDDATNLSRYADRRSFIHLVVDDLDEAEGPRNDDRADRVVRRRRKQ